MALQTIFLLSGILMSIAGHDMLLDEDLKNIIPHHYNIKLSPYKNVDLFRGEYDVTFTILNNTQTITLQSENIFILKAAIISRPRLPQVPENEVKNNLFSKDIYVPTNIVLDKIRKTIVLQFTNTLLPGYHILNVIYFGQINSNDNGLFKIPATDITGKPKWVLTTHLVTSGARELLPHLDDSTGKTTFEISVQHSYLDRVYTSEIAFLQSVTLKADKVKLTHFFPTPPMSVTKISICITPEIVEKHHMVFYDVVLLLPLPTTGLQYDSSIIEGVVENLMPFFTVKFGNIRKSFQIYFFAFLGFQHNTIASFSIVLHRAEDLYFDSTLTVTKRVQKRNIMRFLAHQIALQWLLWFIDSVKPWSSWSYQRINAVAEFLGIFALEKTLPHLKIMDEFVLRTVHDSLHLDVDNLMEPITGQTRTLSTDTHFRIPSFIKLSALLRTIEYKLGQQFWEDGEIYLKHKLPNNIWSCFLSDFQSLPSQPDWNCKTFWIWIVKSNYVLLNVQQRTSCRYAVYVDSSNFINMREEINKNLYRLPFHHLDFRFNVHLDYYTEKNFTMTPECPVVYEKANDTHHCLPAVNARRLGYYRVNYDSEKWTYPEEISILYTRRDNPVLTRAQIIDDEYHLLDKKKTTISAWKRIALYLLTEYEYEAWYPAIRMLEEMSGFLPFSDNSNITSFKALLEESLDKLLRRVGYWTDSDKSDFEIFLLYEAFKWTCLLSSTRCHFFADKVTNNITFFTGANSMQDTVFWQEWIYCKGLRHKTIAVLEYIIRHSMWKNNFNDTLVKYIPCLGFDKAVAYISEIHKIFGTELYKYKHIAVFQSLVAKYANTDTAQILNKLSAIKPRTLKRRTALCIIINHIYSERLLNEILQFFVRAEKKKTPTQDERKDQSLVRRKTNLRMSQIRKHRKRFMQLFR